MGQTETAMFGALSNELVKREYKKNKAHFETDYAENNHKEFLKRQLSKEQVRNLKKIICLDPLLKK